MSFLVRTIGTWRDAFGARTWSNPNVWALVLCVAFVLISSFFLGRYQDHSGDAGQYVTHARNLLWGREWGFLLEGWPAVPVAYPLLLTVPTALFGFSPYAYALVNAALWSLCCFIALKYFYDELGTVPWRIFFLTVCLFSPFVFAFQQRIQPNIAYACVALAAISAFSYLTRENPKTWRWLAAGVVLLPALSRTESLALYGAAGVYALIRRRYELLPLVLLGVVIVVSFDFALASLFNLRPNFELFKGYIYGTEPYSHKNAGVSDYIGMVISYVSRLPELLITHHVADRYGYKLNIGGYTTYFSMTSTVMLAIALFGMTRQKEIFSLDKLFFFAQLGLVSAFLVPLAAPRYLLPILPLFVFYVTTGLRQMLNLAGLAALPWVAAVLMLAALPVLKSTYLVRYQPAKTNTLFSKEMDELVDWLATRYKGETLGYFKTRNLVARLDGSTAVTPKVIELRSIPQAEQLLEQPGSLLIIYNRRFMPERRFRQRSLKKFLEKKPDKVSKVWSDSLHSVFEVRPRD